MKAALQTALRAFGYELRRLPAANQPISQDARLLSRCQRFLTDHRINLVLDVGANAGQYGRALRAFGYAGRIVSFEPLPEAYAELAKAAAGDENWQCYPMAVGETGGSALLNVAGYSECSSLLPMGERHRQALPQSAYRGEVQVRVISLDSQRGDWERPDDRVWLKLDVQGFEKNVLLGATETLAQVQFIDLELSLVPLYEGQALLCEMVALLHARGFEPISLENGFIEPQTGHALQVDGLFARRR